MKTQRLLRLYPRAWRDRYGDEFLELMRGQPLGLQQQFDIIMGAIDAHMAWTPLAKSANVSNQEDRVMVGLRTVCATKGVRMTTRDGLIGAGIYLGVTAALAVAGFILKRNGMEWTAELVLGMAFPVATLFAMPVMFMKGQPLRAQVVVVGSTFSILVLIAYLTALVS